MCLRRLTGPTFGNTPSTTQVIILKPEEMSVETLAEEQQIELLSLEQHLNDEERLTGLPAACLTRLRQLTLLILIKTGNQY